MEALLPGGHVLRPELWAAVLARRITRIETVIGRFTNLRPNGSAAAYLDFSILASLPRSASSGRNAAADAIRVLPRHLPIGILAFVLGCRTPRGLLSWAFFALFNGILIRRSRR
jgi:hypothetical protein